MQLKNRSKEFLGRFSLIYVEGNFMWAYDEISLGLYGVDLIEERVDILLTPMQIHKNKLLKIRGIIKSNHQIILVPQLLCDNWVVYDTKNENISYIRPIELKHQIVEVRQDKNTVFLIPLDTGEPILLFSLKNIEGFQLIYNWNTFSSSDNVKYLCWGSSAKGRNSRFSDYKNKVHLQIRRK